MIYKNNNLHLGAIRLPQRARINIVTSTTLYYLKTQTNPENLNSMRNLQCHKNDIRSVNQKKWNYTRLYPRGLTPTFSLKKREKTD